MSDLFGHPDARVADMTRLHHTVLNHIAGCESRGATCDEVEVALKLPHQTASARVRELVQRGLIRDTGRRRLTRTMREARVYELIKVTNA